MSLGVNLISGAAAAPGQAERYSDSHQTGVGRFPDSGNLGLMQRDTGLTQHPGGAEEDYSWHTMTDAEVYAGLGRIVSTKFSVQRDDDMLNQVFTWEKLDPTKGPEKLYWHKWTFQNTLPEDAPPESLPPLVEVKRETRTGTTTRKHLGVKVELDSLSTDLGKQLLDIQLRHIESMVRLDVKRDRVLTVLDCKDYHVAQRKKRGRQRQTMRELQAQDVALWNIIGKSSRAFARMHETGVKMMAIEGYKPDFLVLPFGSMIGLTMVHPVDTEYSRSGPRALTNVFKSYAGGDRAAEYRGTTVMEINVFNLDFFKGGIEAYNPLATACEIGEQFPMVYRGDPTVFPYRAGDLDIFIPDMTIRQGDFGRITFEQMVRHSGVFDMEAGGFSEHMRDFIEAIKNEAWLTQMRVDSEIRYAPSMWLKFVQNIDGAPVFVTIDHMGEMPELYGGAPGGSYCPFLVHGHSVKARVVESGVFTDDEMRALSTYKLARTKTNDTAREAARKLFEYMRQFYPKNPVEDFETFETYFLNFSEQDETPDLRITDAQYTESTLGKGLKKLGYETWEEFSDSEPRSAAAAAKLIKEQSKTEFQVDKAFVEKLASFAGRKRLRYEAPAASRVAFADTPFATAASKKPRAEYYEDIDFEAAGASYSERMEGAYAPGIAAAAALAPILADRWDAINLEEDVIVRCAAQMALLQKPEGMQLIRWDRQGVFPLAQGKADRISQRWIMGSGFMCQRGCAKTYFGRDNWSFQFYGGPKTALGHYTFHYKTHVEDEAGIYIMRNIVALDYIGGEDRTFIEAGEYDIDDPDSNSIIARLIGPVFRKEDIPSPCYATGFLPGEILHGAPAPRKHKDEERASMLMEAPFYVRAFDLMRMVDPLDVEEGEEGYFEALNAQRNVIMYTGTLMPRNPRTRQHDYREAGDGHWGQRVEPGFGRQRRIDDFQPPSEVPPPVVLAT